MELRAHQKEALKKLSNGKILRGGVGSGKTAVGIAYYREHEYPRRLIVITTAKKRQSLDWVREAALFGIEELTVDSWNNIAKYKEVKDAFVIYDEQRLVGSGTWVKSFLTLAKANRWILLTATPGDNWLDYVPVFVANGFYKNRTEFIREHVVYSYYSKFPKVARYIGTKKLYQYRQQILVEMPFERHTTRHSIDIPVTFDKELMDQVVKKRWHVYEQRPLRDVSELFHVMRKVANSNSSRLEVVVSLLETHPRLIVFYNFDYELDILRTLPDLVNQTKRSEECTSIESIIGTIQEPQIRSSATSLPRKMEEGLCLPTILSPAPITGPKSNLVGSPKIGMSMKMDVPGNTDLTLMPTYTGGLKSTQSSIPLRVAEWNGHKHQEIPSSKSWVYLVQYTAGAEGWNCVETDAMVFYSLPYSYKLFHQAHGRIDRMNTLYKDLYYYTLISDAKIDKLIRESLRVKKSFNEVRNVRFLGP